MIDRPLRWLDRELWDRDLAEAQPWRRYLVYVMRLAYSVLRDLYSGMLTLRAMSLVYTTLLSLVPLLALSFSVLKAFGVHTRVEPLLLGFLAPLGPRAPELTEQIIGFVENVRVGVLGSIGLVLLLYIVLSLIQKIEDAFNEIWHIDHPRSLIHRFSGYLSVILVGPVLVIAAMGITASLFNTQVANAIRETEPFGSALYLGSLLLPYLLAIAAFTLTYLLLPNTRVQVGAALTGGVLAGLAWKLVGLVFAEVAAGATRYDAIYSGFAMVILGLIWVYISWLVLLVGAQLAFYLQHPQFVSRRLPSGQASGADRETLALASMYWVAHDFLEGRPPPERDTLAARLVVPGFQLRGVLRDLIQRRLLLELDEDAVGLLPARDPGAITLDDILAAVRSASQGHDAPEPRLPGPVSEVDSALRSAVSQALAGRTLRDLAQQPPCNPATPRP